jgi:hypothetical protein
VHGKIVFVDETITGELALNQLQLSRKENPRSVLFRKSLIAGSLIFFSAGSFPFIAQAQESLYFVAHDHYLEEPGNLEIEYFSTFGTQRGGNDFHSFWAEFEHGATAWWTTDF